MAKAEIKDEIKLLRELESMSIALEAKITEACVMTEKLTHTREAALVTTKLEEAQMWLGKYQAAIEINLARLTCR